MPGPNKNYCKQLYEVAQTQNGYFTAKQALSAGYSDSMQAYHVKNGDWSKELRGIYRLNNYSNCFDDYTLWYLWSSDRYGNPQGVYSHETALEIHELSSWTSPKIHMTVPKQFRRSATIPACLELHYRTLHQEEIMHKGQILVTTPLRTLLDFLSSGNYPYYYLKEAMHEAIKKNWISHSAIIKSCFTSNQQEFLLSCYQKFNAS